MKTRRHIQMGEGWKPDTPHPSFVLRIRAALSRRGRGRSNNLRDLAPHCYLCSALCLPSYHMLSVARASSDIRV